MKTTILNALLSLGDSADEIAKTLIEKGIKGIRFSTKYCPIGNLIRLQGAKNVDYVSVGVSGLGYYTDNTLNKYISIPLSTELQRFSRKFDCGEYKDLIQ